MAAPSQTRPESELVNPVRLQVERYFGLSLFAMVVTGFVALAGTGKLDPLSLLFVLSALGFRAYLFFTKRNIVLSVQVTSRLTIAYVVFFLLDFFIISGGFIFAVVHLVLFITVVKLFSLQSERDHVYLAIISFLMILASAVLTVDSFFLAAFCLFLLLTVTTSISMEMRRSFMANDEQASENPAQSAEGPVGRAVVASSAVDSIKKMPGSLSLAGAVLVVSIVCGAVVIFFALPRISSGYLSKYASRSSFATGFGEDVTLGEIGRIQQLDTVVMHVQFAEGTRVPPDLKWRGISLSSFNGRRWRNRAQSFTAVRSEPDGQLHLQSRQLQGLMPSAQKIDMTERHPALDYRVSMQPIGTNTLFLLPVPIYITSPLKDFAVDTSGSVVLNDPNRQIRTYNASSVIVAPDTATQFSGQTEIPSAIFEDYLQLPILPKEIANFASDITRNSKSPYQKAAAVEKYLQSHYGYTLEMEAPPEGLDAVSFFLFRRKKGHCEYFSSAMAIMLRTQGIPSRIVNGFRNGEYNDVSGSFIIRAKDAHSWVEAYIPGFGWATFDPTPSVPAGEATTWSRLALYADAMREFWNDWIINYDFSHQEALGNSSISKTRQLFDAARIWIQAKYQSALDRARSVRLDVKRNPKLMGFRGVAVLGSLFLLLNFRRLYSYVRDLRLARKPANAPRAAATIWYERMTRMLGKRGIERQPAQTAQDFLQTIHDERVQLPVAKFTEHYERARFGDSQPDASKLPELYQEVETAMKR
jgi:transglutaminase-like putative cysteine protease